MGACMSVPAGPAARNARTHLPVLSRLGEQGGAELLRHLLLLLGRHLNLILLHRASRFGHRACPACPRSCREGVRPVSSLLPFLFTCSSRASLSDPAKKKLRERNRWRMAGEGDLADIADDALKYETYEQVRTMPQRFTLRLAPCSLALSHCYPRSGQSASVACGAQLPCAARVLCRPSRLTTTPCGCVCLQQYLDSQISPMDIYYLEDQDLARQLVELGYRGRSVE